MWFVRKDSVCTTDFLFYPPTYGNLFDIYFDSSKASDAIAPSSSVVFQVLPEHFSETKRQQLGKWEWCPTYTPKHMKYLRLLMMFVEGVLIFFPIISCTMFTLASDEWRNNVTGHATWSRLTPLCCPPAPSSLCRYSVPPTPNLLQDIILDALVWQGLRSAFP